MAFWVYKQVLRLDITMTVAKRVDVGKRAEALIGVQFDQKDGYGLFHLVVVFEDAIDSLRDVVHHYIQINLILLVTLRVECMLELDNIRVLQFFHNLKFTVFVSLILVNFLDRYNFSSLSSCRLNYQQKGEFMS